MCPNFGTPKSNNFPFVPKIINFPFVPNGTNGKLLFLGVPILKHIMVNLYFSGHLV